MNRQILSLEEELGVPFFERLPVGVRLSTAGEIYYRTFIHHLAEIDRAFETISDLQGVRIGHIRVAVSRSVEAGLLQKAVQGFRIEHPRVNFSIQPTGAEGFAQLLTDDSVDLALITQPLTSETTETLAAAHIPVRAVVARADHKADGISLAQLSEFDLVLPVGPAGFRSHLEAQAKRNRVAFDPALESPILLRPWRGEGPVKPSAQFCLDGTVAGGWLVANAAALVPVARFAPAQVMLCKRAGRILPVAVEKFAQMLVAELEALQP
ncbi:hypothetical protein ACMU_05770 [Actibacterium mucosum KCTC 23349]|uniref:HTH lysR-type domain-containing protein n=1 Tax=Actibacterium mucosum KCTC 23349 TaxID=1454373 RepID=A0A037ZJ62_9RHOB|nr:hypothetical protein ACMU_05770 [Actibacterium mucosum KCTC 23349]